MARWYHRVPWLKVLRVVGCLLGGCIIALGIYSLAVDARTFEPIVADIYRIIFGCLIIVAEFQIVVVLSWFSFLVSLIGVGGFYIFVGGLALGSTWYEITIAVVLVGIGLVYCCAGCACQDDRAAAVDLKAGGSGAASHSSGPSAAAPKYEKSAPASAAGAAPPTERSWPFTDEEEIV